MGLEPEIEDKAAFDALYALHQSDADIYISNGFLGRVRDNRALLAVLTDDENEFLKASVSKHEQEIQLAVAAAEEGNAALIESEARARELEVSRAEAEEARAEAVALATELEKDRNDLKAELEQTAMLQLQSDRMRWQFKTFGLNAPWALGIIVVFLLGILGLLYSEKEGVDVLVPVLAAVLGTYYGALGQAMANLYTPMVKDESYRSSGKRGPKEEAPEP